MFPRQRRHRGPGLAMLMLGGQMAQVGFNNIPPVTLVAIVGQVVTFFRLFKIRWPSTSDVCISSVNVWYKQQYERMFLSAVFHADEWHLYFNMVSLLWKGLRLEPRVGSGYFLYMLVVFTALTNTLYVALGLAAEEFLHEPSYLSTCAVGFSGVLFALKVVTTHMSPPNTERIMGFIPVPSRYACWAELLLIHILVPRASFIGHLSGILVGLLYTRGPLKPLMDSLISPTPTSHNYASSGFTFPWFGRGRRRHTPYQADAHPSRYRDWAASSQDAYTSPAHNTRARTQEAELYTGGMTEEQQLQHAMTQSLRDNPHTTIPRPEPSAPSVDSDTPHGPPFPTNGSDSHGPPYPTAGPPYPTDSPPYPSVRAHETPTDGPPYPSVRAQEIPTDGPPYPSVRAQEIPMDGPPYPSVGARGPPTGDPPSYSRLYPDLSRDQQDPSQSPVTRSQARHDQEELRRRRLQRFDK